MTLAIYAHSIYLSVWLNFFLLIGNLLNLKIICNNKMLVFIISILTTRLKKIEKLHLLHIKSLFSCRSRTFFILDVICHGQMFVLFFENCLDEV